MEKNEALENLYDRKRGIQLVVIDPQTNKVILKESFDTFTSSERFDYILMNLLDNYIVAAAVHEEATQNLSLPAIGFFKELGSLEIDILGLNETWAFIGVVGTIDFVEERKAAGEGTAAVTMTLPRPV